MSQLIQMRQRIKAIETIKKITHAMRLISMSTHLQLKKKETALLAYRQALADLFSHIKPLVPDWHHDLINPPAEEQAHLIILVSSQKGLCGAFNETLFNFFEKKQSQENTHLITVGKRAADYIISKQLITKQTSPLVAQHDHFSSLTLPSITKALLRHLKTQKKPYQSVTVISNSAANFFMQKPQLRTIIPFTAAEMPAHTTEQKNEQKITFDDYVWEQQPHAILNVLAEQYLEAAIHLLLFESLLAEQAARFISMDSSTRNAKKLLEAKRLAYNKLRQTKITKELTELVGSF